MTGFKHLTKGFSAAGQRVFKRAVCHARRCYPSHDPRRLKAMRDYFGRELQRVTSP